MSNTWFVARTWERANIARIRVQIPVLYGTPKIAKPAVKGNNKSENSSTTAGSSLGCCSRMRCCRPYGIRHHTPHRVRNMIQPNSECNPPTLYSSIRVLRVSSLPYGRQISATGSHGAITRSTRAYDNGAQENLVSWRGESLPTLR